MPGFYSDLSIWDEGVGLIAVEFFMNMSTIASVGPPLIIKNLWLRSSLIWFFGLEGSLQCFL